MASHEAQAQARPARGHCGPAHHRTKDTLLPQALCKSHAQPFVADEQRHRWYVVCSKHRQADTPQPLLQVAGLVAKPLSEVLSVLNEVDRGDHRACHGTRESRGKDAGIGADTKEVD